MIQKSRIASGYPVLLDRDLRLYSATWAEVLHPVATDWLNECYASAIRVHDLAKPFSPIEIFTAWSNAVSSGDVEKSRHDARPALPEVERICCSMDGWMIVSRNGERATNFDGITYARACSTHRPQGWQVGKWINGEWIN